ncbi:hypothetical protein CQA44_10850 [Helicobacter sp. MIT 14-3879]|nr:hypothetical protein CQA44_10850 [Helicobacter sp. MIT 14-3879]
MFIQKIIICNIFAYYGRVEVNFGEKIEGKNLYCIYGNNGFGKTSFINACKILFLGTGLKEGNIPHSLKHLAPSATSPKKFIKGNEHYRGILNTNACDENKEDFYIIFEGFLQDKKFRVQRTWEGVHTQEINETLELKIDNQSYYNEEAQEKLNICLLPTNFVDFFFFNGEEIGEISENIRKGLRDKIEEILKIKPLDIILREIEKYKRELKEKQADDDKTRLDYKIKNRELESLNEKIEHYKKLYKEKSDDLENNKQHISQKTYEHQKIIADDDKEMQKLYDEKNKLEIELEEHKEKLSDSLKNIIFMSNKSLTNTLKQELHTLKSHSRKEDIEVFNRLLPEIKEITQTYLQENPEINSQEINYVMMNALENIPKALATKNTYHSKISNANALMLERAFIRLEYINLYQDINEMKECKIALKDTKTEIEELKIDDYKQERKQNLEREIKQLRDEQNELEHQKRESENDLKQVIEQKKEIEREIYHLNQKINTERIDNELHFLQELEQSIKNYREKLIIKLRFELRDKILKKYKNLLPNDNIKDLVIDENFEIALKNDKDGLVIIESQSSGQKQILAIAIFWALSELSKAQIPLIIDTPLGRIDGQNRVRIIQNYYAQNLQTIILPTDTEVSKREYEYAKSHIARLYKIENSDDRGHARINNAMIDEIL